MKKGIIEIEDMTFYAYHGCYETEQIVGNHFTVSVKLETDITKPAATDRIEDAVNYVEVYEIVSAQMAIKSHLLEHVASRIAGALKNSFPEIERVTVKVSKKFPPIGGQAEKTSVTLSC